MIKFVMLLLWVSPDGVTHSHSYTKEFVDKPACIKFGQEVFKSKVFKEKRFTSQLVLCTKLPKAKIFIPENILEI